jgi:hypothetical protein
MANCLVSSPNAAIAYDFLVRKGLTCEQAAAVIGNLQEESGLDPAKSKLDPNKNDPKAISRGIAMWQPSRWRNLLNFASGRDPLSLSTQLDFLWYELQTDPSNGLAPLLASTSLEEAVVVFQNHFERPSIPHTDVRIACAQSALFSCPAITPPPKAKMIAAAFGIAAVLATATYGVIKLFAPKPEPELLPPPDPEFP